MPLYHTKTKLKESRGSVGNTVGHARPRRGLKLVWCWLTCWLPGTRWLRRIILGFMVFILLLVGGMYGIAQWYIHTQSNKPLEYGVSFIPDYAQSLGLDPQQTMDALLNIGVKQ